MSFASVTFPTSTFRPPRYAAIMRLSSSLTSVICACAPLPRAAYTASGVSLRNCKPSGAPGGAFAAPWQPVQLFSNKRRSAIPCAWVDLPASKSVVIVSATEINSHFLGIIMPPKGGFRPDCALRENISSARIGVKLTCLAGVEVKMHHRGPIIGSVNVNARWLSTQPSIICAAARHQALPHWFQLYADATMYKWPILEGQTTISAEPGFIRTAEFMVELRYSRPIVVLRSR